MIWAQFPEIRRELDRVRAVILEEVARPGGRIAQGLTDLAGRDAKLLRPAFTILAARIQAGGAAVDERVIRLAAAIELLHMASLVHDDIVDDAVSRRGGAALHVSYGSRAAVLMGDYLFSRCFALVADHAEPENASFLSAAVGHIIGSEIAETDGGWDTELSVRRYLHRVIGKTAVLFALSFHVGAAEALPDGGDERIVQILRRVGYNVGVGFQIIDDLLDLFGSPQKTGKPRRTDLRQGVITLPVIIAANSMQRSRLIRILSRMGSTSRRGALARRWRDRAIDRVCLEIERAGGTDGAIAAAEIYTRRAEREIDRLPDTPDRRILQRITTHLLERAS